MECGGATTPGAVLVYLHCREKLLSQVNVLPNTQAPFREHMGRFFAGVKLVNCTAHTESYFVLIG